MHLGLSTFLFTGFDGILKLLIFGLCLSESCAAKYLVETKKHVGIHIQLVTKNGTSNECQCCIMSPGCINELSVSECL